MKRIFPAARAGSVLALALLLCGPARADDVVAPLRAVDKVDLARYAGRWYEIARYPNRFQRKCASDVTAEYRPLPNRQMEVVNRCKRADGSFDEALGRARVVDPFSNARLEVRFAPAWLSWLPWVWGDYWVIDLAEDYSVAVVSEPERDYLWVLARSPHMAEANYARIQAWLSRRGFDPARMIRTVQGGLATPAE